ncbi:hypothetical protein BC835DRAFT_1338397 [Cytidiella melzeri]|nr:hypothetical protein BC835DRAFT_1338397 [Cytidiella melzeri]
MPVTISIYRLFVIYHSNWLVIVIPVLVFSSATELITSFTPGGFFFGNRQLWDSAICSDN